MEIHQQLQQAREAKGLSLAELHNRIGVRREVLSLIDSGAFEELPSGLYGRHALRAYAMAVGVDAEHVLEEASPRLPKPEDPLDGLARVRGLGRRRRAVAGLEDSNFAGRAPLMSSDRGENASESASDWRPLAASAIDGAILVSVVLLLAQLTAVAAGTPMGAVVAVAAPAWTLMAALIAAVYFVLLAGVRNATLGARLVDVRGEENPTTGMDAGTAVRRGLRCALRESSILVEWLVTVGPRQNWLRVVNQPPSTLIAVDKR